MKSVIQDYTQLDDLSINQPIYLIDSQIQQHPFFRPREKKAHKGNFGKLLLVGGHKGMGGAIRLSGEIAMRCGTGLVVVATDPANQPSILSAIPELMTQSLLIPEDLYDRVSWCDCIGLGPGLGRDTWSQNIFNYFYDPKLSEPKLIVAVSSANEITFCFNTLTYFIYN